MNAVGLWTGTHYNQNQAPLPQEWRPDPPRSVRMQRVAVLRLWLRRRTLMTMTAMTGCVVSSCPLMVDERVLTIPGRPRS